MTKGTSQSNFGGDIFSASGAKQKLTEPALHEANSGLAMGSDARRSSLVIPMAPPVVQPIMTSHLLRMPSTTSRIRAGSPVGCPVSGSRVCRCTTAAPALLAATASSMICWGVIGRYGVRDGVCTAPVMAAVKIGGLIQSVPFFDDPDVVLVCNDEGKLMNLPANRGLKDESGQIYDIICGTFFLCGAPAGSDHFTSLSPEQIERYRERFYTPEIFWGMDGRIVCLPLELD